jgi:hypothetical protein
MLAEPKVVQRADQPYVAIWDVTETEGGQRWGARLEIYESDPALEPDMNQWVTELAFRLAG